jgi:nicotinate-nucleotide adenylyltransferase
MKKMRLGILGGTFNPPHNGHIFLAKEVLRKLKLTKILFIPCGIPPHKNLANNVSGQQRLRMTQLAIKGNTKFLVSDIEIKRKGPSYAVETIGLIRKKYSKAKEIFYIMGSDAIAEILTWKEPIKLFTLVNFIVVPRHGYPLVKALKIFKKKYLSRFTNKIKILKAIIPGISSSQIRERIENGKSIKGLVPVEVEKFINKKKLYSIADSV